MSRLQYALTYTFAFLTWTAGGEGSLNWLRPHISIFMNCDVLEMIMANVDEGI